MSYKTPRTRQEAAQAVSIEEALEMGVRVRVRAKRNARNLPNAHDDVPCNAERNWKRHRRKQWEASPPQAMGKADQELTSRFHLLWGCCPLDIGKRESADNTSDQKGSNMNKVNKTPEVICEGGKKFFKTITVGGEKVIVAKKGAPGTMRQTVRQNSSKKMRNGRKTDSRKNHVAFRCDKDKAKALAKESGIQQHFVETDPKTGEKKIVARNLTPKEAWNLFL